MTQGSRRIPGIGPDGADRYWLPTEFKGVADKVLQAVRVAMPLKVRRADG